MTKVPMPQEVPIPCVEPVKTEFVNHPKHYNSGSIEVISAIYDWGLDFDLGNAVKYIARAGKKDPEKYVEDLKKAIWYCEHKIKMINRGMCDD